ncbi:MAG: hypothetical protein P8X47_00860 [Ignavibacteriaceae bacterium]
MKIYSTLIILISIIIISSCERKEYTEEGILQIKREIDSLLYHPDSEEHFDWGSATAYSTFRAYFHDSKLIFINEDYRYRKAGDSFNRYYFKDRNMLYFIGKEITYMPDKTYHNTEMMVDPDGNVITYDNLVNGKRVGLSNEELNKIVEHAKVLENIVKTRMDANTNKK